MALSSFAEFVVHDLLGDISGITARTMFGGYGIYKEGVIFAIIADKKLYFKVDDETRAKYEKEGSEPFIYEASKGKKMVMSYWLLPERFIEEDREELKEWVKEAVMAHKPKSSRKLGRKSSLG